MVHGKTCSGILSKSLVQRLGFFLHGGILLLALSFDSVPLAAGRILKGFVDLAIIFVAMRAILMLADVIHERFTRVLSVSDTDGSVVEGLGHFGWVVESQSSQTYEQPHQLTPDATWCAVAHGREEICS